EGSDDTSKCLSGCCTVGGDGDGDGKFEVIARSGERQGGGARVSESECPAEQVAADPHDGEVRQQRQSDAGNVEGAVSDLVTLKGKQDDDSEKQAVQRPRADFGHERRFVPASSLCLFAESSRQVAGQQRDAKK